MDEPGYEQSGADLRSLLAAAYAFEDEVDTVPIKHDEADASPSGKIAARHEEPSLDSVEDRTSMDSKAFDIRDWMESRKLLSLDTLFAQHEQLVSEVNKLQSEMQTLVYDNYSRFIDATDIIHNMRSDFKGMAKDTTTLQQKMTVVAQKSEAVNTNLQTQRANLQHLNQLHNVLRNLQAVLKLSQELHEFVASGDLTSAVELYSRAQALLKRYGHRGILRDVKRESDAIMQDVKQELLDRIQNADNSTEVVKSAVQLLIILNVGPDLLRTRFLAGRRQRLGDVLAEVARVVACMASQAKPEAASATDAPVLGDLALTWGDEEGKLPCLDTFIVRLDNRLLSYLTQSVLMYQEVFANSAAIASAKQPTMDKHVKAMAQEIMRAYVGHVKNAVAYCGSLAARGSSTVKGTSRLLEESNASTMRDAFPGDWGIAALVHAIGNIKTSLHRANAFMPELSLRDKGAEVVEGAIRHHVGAAFTALEELVLAQVAFIGEQLAGGSPTGAQLTLCVANLIRTLMAGCDSLLQTFKKLADNEELLKGWQDVFVDLLQAQLQHLFLSLINHFLLMAGTLQSDGSVSVRRVGVSFRAANESTLNPLYPSTPNKAAAPAESSAKSTPERPGEPSNPATPAAAPVDGASGKPSSMMVLLLACFCKDMKDKAVAGALEAVARYIPNRTGGTGTGLSPPAFVAAEVQRRLSRAVTSLLNAFVQSHACRATPIVTDAVTDPAFLQVERPGPPRPFVASLQAAVQAAAGEALSLLPRGDPLPFSFLPASAAHGRHSRHGSAADGDDQPSDVRVGVGLFQERGRLALDDVEANVHSVVVAVATHLLQSFVEVVRLQDLSQAALHQLQVDLALLRQVLSHARLRPFIDDILSSGMDRCENPVLMDSASVDALMKLAN